MLSLRFSLLASVAGLALGLAMPAGALFAQQGYSPADIQAGKQLYRVNCSHCHGPNGDSVVGRRSRPRHFQARLHRQRAGRDHGAGHPWTRPCRRPICATRRRTRSSRICDRWQPQPTPAARIRPTWRTARRCSRARAASIVTACAGEGSRVGPDLTNIGARRKRDDIERSIVDPDAEILRGKPLHPGGHSRRRQLSQEESSTKILSRCNSSTAKRSCCHCKKRI